MKRLKKIPFRILVLGVFHFMIMFTTNAQKEDHSFIYRESYFPLVSASQEFQKEYQTMPLDDYWGIWGHNLPKLISEEEETENLYAVINNQINREQFCFSSRELKQILVNNIQRLKASYSYYMIAPNDNLLVCQCDRCLENGNTATNAAPSVFRLLNDLAEEFPDLHFFTTAYLSITGPPKEKPKDNVGVFFSTINYQAGETYKKVNQKNKLIGELERWNTNVKHLFVWEYALNYDNYLDFYPSLKVFQQNLKFLKKHKVNGVFVNGSETYSVLQEIKCSVTARLLSEIDGNLDDLLLEEFNKRFPKEVAELANNYYKELSSIFFNSKEEMGIYAGIKDAKIKYLDFHQLNEFYQELIPLEKKHKNNLNVKALTLSVIFLKLEMMRASGITENGYGLAENEQIKIKPEVSILLNHLRELSLTTGITTYNEQGSSIAHYIYLWEEEIIQKKKKNHFLKKEFKVLSNLDEGYHEKTMLNDGSYGFLDYNTNWLINSIDNLEIEIPIPKISFGKSTINIGFLNDPKHNILFPKEIELKNQGKIVKVIAVEPSNHKEKKQISIPVTFANYNHTLVLKVKRAENGTQKSATACDEITIN